MRGRYWLTRLLGVLCALAYGAALWATQFTGTELLGRPTDTSVAVSVVADSTLEAYFEVGTSPSTYSVQTPVATYAAGVPIVVEVEHLLPNTRYFYRMRYRAPGAAAFEARSEHTFHTQRARGETFTFTVQADPHLGDPNTDEGLYRVELQNALSDGPDFHVDLGDTFMTEKYGATCADAVADCLANRPFFGLVGASAPLFLTNGNHEGELGWLLDGTSSGLPVCSTQARRTYYPCPVPAGFYGGASVAEPFVGVRDGYYSWEWGDALFVILDPFWYTVDKPVTSGDGWSWTLGREQYEWLLKTLEESRAPFKIVFIHHLVGGLELEGRGGIEGAGLYEWGGANIDGSPGFAAWRPGWAKPIHQLLRDNGVSVVFHGHDHVFVKQDLDGIVYQECPRPDFKNYNDTSNAGRYGYLSGVVRPNSGHLRVTVSPAQLEVDYVRAYLPGDGNNGQVANSYTVQSPAPSAAFVASPANPRAGETVSFTDQSLNGPTSWSWDFGDGSTSTSQNPTHTYAAQGNYGVTLTAGNARGSTSVTHALVVTSPCMISGAIAALNPFRLKLAGLYFEAGCTVFVNSGPAPVTIFRSAGMVVAKGDGLKAMLPKGAAVELVVQNPGGGTSAPFTYVR